MIHIEPVSTHFGASLMLLDITVARCVPQSVPYTSGTTPLSPLSLLITVVIITTTTLV
jgi:hypothetical protein